jgi:hypothetical protein
MKKEVKVVMLPTEKKAPSKIILWEITKSLDYYTEAVTTREKKSGIPQHLYFLSDEKPVFGDYVYHKDSNTIFRFDLEEEVDLSSYQKIIATTDKSLLKVCPRCDDEKQLDTGMFGMVDCDFCYYKNHDNLKSLQLPRPSDEFLKKFCELGGIDKVLVEYEAEYQYKNNQMVGIKDKLKVAPDGTISIYPLKNKL